MATLIGVHYAEQVKTRPPCFTLFLRGKGEYTDVDARTVTNGLRCVIVVQRTDVCMYLIDVHDNLLYVCYNEYTR